MEESLDHVNGGGFMVGWVQHPRERLGEKKIPKKEERKAIITKNTINLFLTRVKCIVFLISVFK